MDEVRDMRATLLKLLHNNKFSIMRFLSRNRNKTEWRNLLFKDENGWYIKRVRKVKKDNKICYLVGKLYVSKDADIKQIKIEYERI